MNIQVELHEADVSFEPLFGEEIKVSGASALKYATSCQSLFADAQFPDGYELIVDISGIASNISNMFRRATGLTKLTLKVDEEVLPTRVYNAGYFFYGTATIKPSVVEIHLPDGIKFSDFGRFAGYCNSLKKISGSIDLSECTVTQYCFMDCYALEEVRFVPSTICLSIDFANSAKLSTESIQSIIGGLAQVETSQTLTVHPDVAAQITETDVTGKGWTLAYKGK